MDKTNNTSVGSKVFTESMVTIVLLTVEAAFAIFGVAGNILVCVVIATRPNMKKIMNCYLLSLAVADLGILLVLYPFAILNHQHPNEYFLGKAFCHYIGPTLEIFIAASIWSITVIAIERYFTVVRSSRLAVRRRGNIPKRVYFIILAVWLLSFLLFCLPLFFVSRYEEGDSPSTSKCQVENLELFKIYAIYIGVATYLLPLIVICYTYCQIMIKLRKSKTFHDKMWGETTKDSVSRSQKSQTNLAHREQRKVEVRNIMKERTNQTKRILTPLVILFALSMLPINTLRFMITFWEGTSQLSYFSILFNVAVFCFLINSAMNPLIYLIASQEFRTGFRHILERVSFGTTFLRTVLSRAGAQRSEQETRL